MHMILNFKLIGKYYYIIVMNTFTDNTKGNFMISHRYATCVYIVAIYFVDSFPVRPFLYM